MIDSKKSSQKIKAKRNELGWTQDAVAFQLNISQNAYSKIELGYSRITIDRLGEIANVLNVDPVTLL